MRTGIILYFIATYRQLLLLMTMEHGAAYDQETIMDMMDSWLVTMTVDGEPVIPEEETVENE